MEKVLGMSNYDTFEAIDEFTSTKSSEKPKNRYTLKQLDEPWYQKSYE